MMHRRDLHVALFTGCERFLSGKKGTVKSLNYPGYFTPKLKCFWRIEVKKNRFLKLKFNKFEVNGTQNGGLCRENSIEIFEGKDMNFLGRYNINTHSKC